MSITLYNHDSLTVTVDPKTQFADAPVERVIAACGYLTYWALDYFTSKRLGPTLKAHMEECYGFGLLHPVPEAAQIKDSVFTYPNDPDLYPYMLIEKGGEPPTRCLIYPHAIIAFEENGQTFITRMD